MWKHKIVWRSITFWVQWKPLDDTPPLKETEQNSTTTTKIRRTGSFLRQTMLKSCGLQAPGKTATQCRMIRERSQHGISKTRLVEKVVERTLEIFFWCICWFILLWNTAICLFHLQSLCNVRLKTGNESPDLLRIYTSPKTPYGPRMGSNRPPVNDASEMRGGTPTSQVINFLRPKVPQAAIPNKSTSFQACIMPMSATGGASHSKTPWMKIMYTMVIQQTKICANCIKNNACVYIICCNGQNLYSGQNLLLQPFRTSNGF